MTYFQLEPLLEHCHVVSASFCRVANIVPCAHPVRFRAISLPKNRHFPGMISNQDLADNLSIDGNHAIRCADLRKEFIGKIPSTPRFAK